MDDKMKKEASKIGSNELIANAIAERMLKQASKGKSKAELAKELNNSKKALVLA